VDPWWLFFSVVTGSIGLALFVYGKKQLRWPQIVAGLLFMIYPYFTETVPAMLGVGVLIGAVLWYAVWMGW